jgi:hypothetical protein
LAGGDNHPIHALHSQRLSVRPFLRQFVVAREKIIEGFECSFLGADLAIP